MINRAIIEVVSPEIQTPTDAGNYTLQDRDGDYWIVYCDSFKKIIYALCIDPSGEILSAYNAYDVDETFETLNGECKLVENVSITFKGK